MRNLGLAAAAAGGLLLSGCGFDDDRRYDGGRYRYGGYSAGAIDQSGRGVGRSPGYSTGEAANAGIPARLRRRGCDDAVEVCYKDGRPDVSDTRDRYGRRAASRIDD